MVLARAKHELPGVAPGNGDLGVMLPYTSLHHLLFHFGVPPVLVMTSGNRSGIPMVYRGEDALEVLGSVADALLIGERAIARRVDDSVVRLTAAGPVMIRRAREYAPRFVARLPAEGPVLALGGNLKSAVALVVDGRALFSEHLGDLETCEAQVAFEAAVEARLSMDGVSKTELIVAFDCHPDYRSAQFAETLPARRRVPLQHHRTYIAGVLAEREAPEARVVAGGVFQNAVLLEALKAALEAHGVPLWGPRAVPPNDGG
ncbi:MAG: Sua5/YciO/YrdC/YwlC family protein [Hydrogenibacillus schlegelii]|nr:Sua5/YciO/YrdC/YwlC family protein [Hydrogenibacillus schlegelii]